MTDQSIEDAETVELLKIACDCADAVNEQGLVFEDIGLIKLYKAWQAARQSSQSEPVAYLYRILGDKHATGEPREGEIFVDGYWGKMTNWMVCTPDKLDEAKTSYYFGKDSPRPRPGFECKPLYLAAPQQAIPSEPTEEMKDGARAFLGGLELGIKSFEHMASHLELSGAYLPRWFLESKGHLNKMAKAHYIYEAMLIASPTAPIESDK
jgi:hypothetical protein